MKMKSLYYFFNFQIIIALKDTLFVIDFEMYKFYSFISIE